MLFNSYEFIFAFLPAVFVCFFAIARRHHFAAASWLGLASLFFYGYWSIYALPLLIISICINYLFGKSLAVSPPEAPTQRRRKFTIVAAISFNLAVLGFFKYANFFIRTTNHALGALSIQEMSYLDIVLPIGISFFTFTQIAFLVDCYEGKVKERNFVHYLLFVSYFPHLIAGPVLHHSQMMPQFARRETYRINFDNVSVGLILFAIGLAKKVLLADGRFAPYSGGVFNAVADGATPNILEAWIGALAYTLQLYFDFSGYSDMALGISKLFNIDLPINFNSPYKAPNIIEFWRRWHMSLSTFLRDYLYFPLGGNRRGELRRYFNLLVTMILGGLWHGASGTFVLWGGLHGIYLALNHLWRKLVPEGLAKFLPTRLANGIGIASTFLAVVVAFVMFRAAGIRPGLSMLKAMFGIDSSPLVVHDIWQGALFTVVNLPGRDPIKDLLLGLAIIWLLPNSNQLVLYVKNVNLLAQKHRESAIALVFASMLALAAASLNIRSEFLYFQF